MCPVRQVNHRFLKCHSCKFCFRTDLDGPMRARLPGAHLRTLHANQYSGHLSQCFTLKHHSVLRPRLPDPCRLGGPRVGGVATSPLPSPGSPPQVFSSLHLAIRTGKNANTLQSNLSSRHVMPLRYTQLAKAHSQMLKLPASQGKTTSWVCGWAPPGVIAQNKSKLKYMISTWYVSLDQTTLAHRPLPDYLSVPGAAESLSS